MVKVNMTEDDFKAPSKYFGLGEHAVGITSVKIVTDDKDRDYLQFEFAGQDDPDTTGDCRIYMHTEKSAKYAIRTLQAIASHNATTDTEKDRIKSKFVNIGDTDDLKPLLKNYENNEAFIQVYEDTNAPKPNGGYYKRTNIFGYMPSPRKPSVDELMAGSTQVSNDDVPFN